MPARHHRDSGIGERLSRAARESKAATALAGRAMMRARRRLCVKDWQRALVKRYYDKDEGFKDGTEVHCELIESLVTQGGRFLEIGSGPTNPTTRRLGKLGELCGIDPGESVLRNEDLHEAKVFDGVHFPYEDESFDACFSTYVMEHVEDADAHVSEVFRVLKPGGLYIFRAANVFHYVTMTARLTPFWFHRIANWLRVIPDDFEGPYPTFYRLSTGGQVRRAAKRAGLEVQSLEYIEKEPWYGMVWKPLFLAFTAYERLVNSTERLRGLRSTLLGVLRKPEATSTSEAGSTSAAGSTSEAGSTSAAGSTSEAGSTTQAGSVTSTPEAASTTEAGSTHERP